MTKEQALAELRELGGDPEADHHAADSILLALIDDEEITKAYHAVRKWYA
jgi:hypothetical protein